MRERMRHRLGDERGVTMIELLVVMIVIGILLAIAVPSYLTFRQRAATNETKAHLRAALPVAAAYYADKGTYVGMNYTTLLATDPRVAPTLTVASARKAHFCLTDTVNGMTWSVDGPATTDPTFHRSDNCT